MLQPKKEKSKALYDAISQDYDLGTYEEFHAKLGDSTKRRAFYNGIGNEYNLGTYEEFEGKLLKKKDASESTSQNQELASEAKATDGLSATQENSPNDNRGQLVKDLDSGKFDDRLKSKNDLQNKYTLDNRQSFTDEEWEEAQRLGYAPPNSKLIAQSITYTVDGTLTYVHNWNDAWIKNLFDLAGI